MYEQQPLKMSSAEALCETEAPAPFSIFAFGKLGCNECDDVHSITVPDLLSFLAHGDFSTAVPGVNELQQRYADSLRRDLPRRPVVRRQGRRSRSTTQPVLAVTYWNFRLMIGMGAVSAAVAAYALWSTRKGRVPSSRIGVYGSLLAVGGAVRGQRVGLDLHRDGPAAVRRRTPTPTCPRGEQVYFFTAQAVSPGVTAARGVDLADRADRSSTACWPSSSSG